MNIIHRRMWVRPLLIGIVVSLTSSPVSAEQPSVTINVSGLRSQKGQVVVCLWRQQDKNFPMCSNSASFEQMTVKAAASKVTVAFQNIPTGDYAVSAFHDENQDGSINRGFMGMPKEGIAFSNMTQERGRPSFDKAKFTLNGPKTISLSLMYL
jgi:uncharacterized protein (DUF2141 family)